MVQFVNVRELKNNLSKVMRKAHRGDVIVTSRGKPAAVLHAIGAEDLEDYLLAQSPKFRKSLESAYRQYRRRGGVSREKLLSEVERQLERVHR